MALEAELEHVADRCAALEGGEQAAPRTIHLEQGQLVNVLSADEAIQCGKANLGGIVTAQISYDAAFDMYVLDVEDLPWRPTAGDDCAANVAFRLSPFPFELVPTGTAPAVPAGVAVITRGEGRGRVLAVDYEARVYELPRISEADLPILVKGGGWVGSMP